MDNCVQTELTAPDSDLDSLSFAQPDPSSVGEWVSKLPMANVPEATGQVRQAAFEIARLKTDWPTRMALLETIRPTVLYLTTRLDRNVGGTGAQETNVRLAQRLQTNLCSGYIGVVLSATSAARKNRKALGVASLAIHRAISDLSRTLLRTLQFYVTPADRFWFKLNALYRLAEQLGIDADKHPDSDSDASPDLSIAGTYLRALLLAMARPYQLRPHQLSSVFHMLGNWVPMVSLSPADDKDLHLVALDSDQGPGHADRFEQTADTRGIRSEVLVYELQAAGRGADNSLNVPKDVDAKLLEHLADSWDKPKPRTFGRADASDAMKVCVGLSAIHYYLSEGTRFSELLPRAGGAPAQKNPFFEKDVKFVPNEVERHRDVWAEAPDAGGKIPQNPFIENPEVAIFNAGRDQKQGTESHARERQHGGADEAGERYECYDATTMDTSPGGYRLRWNQPFPPNVQSGELVALKEISEQNWCLAVARWLRQDASGAFMGIQLVAPQATPVAIRVIQTKGGQTQFHRAFLLPNLKAMAQPASLITPTAPFQTGQKILLIKDGTQTTAQLGDCLLKTESFNQFTFRVLDGYLEKPSRRRNMGSLYGVKKHQRTGFR